MHLNITDNSNTVSVTVVVLKVNYVVLGNNMKNHFIHHTVLLAGPSEVATFHGDLILLPFWR